MTNEELERAMQFILEQQAQFAANQQQAGERVARLETSMAEMARAQQQTGERMSLLETSMVGMAQAQQQTGERVARLETNMAEMARAQTHMNEVIAVMVETHRHTEEKLDAFIGVLERYISEGRNGKGNDGSGI